jgi:hypothetical protein
MICIKLVTIPTFVFRKVTYTTIDALKNMVNDLPILLEENTGCIVNEVGSVLLSYL